MKRETFQSGLDQIYDIFSGSRRPSSEAKVTWFGRLQHIPEEAVAFIVERICDMERLPANMTLAWKNLWSDWRAANPSRIIRPYCQACGNAGARFLWAPAADGGWRNFSVPCPACQSSESQPPVSLQELEEQGCVIMPVDYSGGQVAFDRDKGFGCLWPLGMDISTPRREMRVGVTLRQDYKRLRHLPENEREDYRAGLPR